MAIALSAALDFRTTEVQRVPDKPRPLDYLTYTKDCTSRPRFRVPIPSLTTTYAIPLAACDSVAYSLNRLLDSRDNLIYASLANSLIKTAATRNGGENTDEVNGSNVIGSIRTVSVRVDGRRYTTDTSLLTFTSTTARNDGFTEDFAGDIAGDSSGDSVDNSCACSGNGTVNSNCRFVKGKILEYGRHSCTDQMPLFTYSIPLYSCASGLTPTFR